MRIRPAMFAFREADVVIDGGEIVRAKVMVPVPRFASLCARQYTLDEVYALGPVENVSNSSRGGFFASVREGWNNLPEDDARFPSEEHLRKRALVNAGWATHQHVVMGTPKDARQLALEARKIDAYAVITVNGNVVDIWIAKSIAGGQITAEEWKDVKPRALAYIAGLSGTTRAELERHSKDGGAR